MLYVLMGILILMLLLGIVAWIDITNRLDAFETQLTIAMDNASHANEEVLKVRDSWSEFSTEYRNQIGKYVDILMGKTTYKENVELTQGGN